MNSTIARLSGAGLMAVTLAAGLAAGLSGCGQTGPLYMPNPPAKPAAANPVPPQPVPSNNASIPAPTK